jgi:hypothetical protein
VPSAPQSLRPSYPWIGLVAGPIAALASFLLAYFLDPLNFGGSGALAAVPATLLAIVVLLIGQNVAAYRELERAANQSREIYEAVKDYLHVTKVGSPERAMRYVTSRLPILQEVRNTSFNIRGQTDRANDMFYETDLYADFREAIAEWSCKGVRWKDIGDGLAAERFRAIRAAAEGKGRSRYQYRLVLQNEPQLNFVLLSYPDGTAEVLFNWDFRNFGQDPVVLLSRDRDIVEMFTVQFEHLWMRASRDHDVVDAPSS